MESCNSLRSGSCPTVTHTSFSKEPRIDSSCISAAAIVVFPTPPCPIHSHAHKVRRGKDNIDLLLQTPQILTIPWAPTLLCFFCCCPPRAADVSKALLVPSLSNAPFSCDKSSFRTRYEVGSSGTEAGTCARALASSADAVGDLTSLEPCTFFVATDERDFCDARKASHSSLLIDGAIGLALRMASASEFDRTYSHVLLYPPQPAAMLSFAPAALVA
mgnify:CR=1 FL=1